MTFDHEQLLVRRGPRSGLPIAIAVHSTALGMALGGCRLRHYPDAAGRRPGAADVDWPGDAAGDGWRGGVADALRLAASMTYKAAVAGLDHGGGKTVVALPTPARSTRPPGGSSCSTSATPSNRSAAATVPARTSAPARMTW